MNNPILLGVNVDHVATLRQARGTRYPDPLFAAQLAEQAGADGITMHLREDRRHIQDRDIFLAKEMLQTRLNLEMAVTEEMLSIAEQVKPEHCCLVPEKREELTTEGGLDVSGNFRHIKKACTRLAKIGSEVSLFIDPSSKQIEAAVACGAPAIEIHTGAYADAETDDLRDAELDRILEAVSVAKEEGLIINAGHGLNCQNVMPIAAIPEINELNIGHSLVADAVYIGFPEAVKRIKSLMMAARQ